MNRLITRLLITGTLLFGSYLTQAQTNTVEFGQNRIQHKNFKWRYYQTRHFNTYFSQNGLELGKYVAQVAEKELPQLEGFMEFTFRQRVNIVVYNSFGEMKQSNIGIGVDWQNTGGITKLVGNKLIVYFDGDHQNLHRQIREGIARVMLESLLFGEDIGEFAGNAVLIDFPKWFTDGFVAYAAENWNTKLDDELKDAIQSGRYRDFYQLAYEKPTLAGQAFWYYVESKYGKDAVPYLMYISRINRGLKKGFEQVLNQKPKNALKDFMVFNAKRYQDDNRRRRQTTRGARTIVSRELNKSNFYRFQANPKSNYYAVVEFSKGLYKVQIQFADMKPKVLLRSGVRMQASQLDPNYPLLAWNQKGNRLAIVYEREGVTKLMVYDLVSRTTTKQDLPRFDRIIDMKYFFEYDNSLLLSAVKNGHTDIYTYSINKATAEQITNDVYDDLDPSFVAFPGKSGIVYSSNRPSPTAKSGDTVLPAGHYNIFLIDNWNKSADKQISQLTNMKYGDARSPLQYNTTHFTFVSDVNGIRNRYAGFFKTERTGVDSLFFVGSEILHNPDKADLDSALAEYGATEPDSVMAVSLTKDSTYTFPMSNYSYGIKESRGAGDQGEVSQVIQQYGFKNLQKLRIDTVTLRKRNVSSRPTTFRARQMREDSLRMGLPTYHEKTKEDTVKHDDFFQSEFGKEAPDTSATAASQASPQIPLMEPVLKKAKLLPYKLKFSSDYLILQLDNSVLINRYQPFTGPPSGPIRLSDPLNGLIRIGVSDLMEDFKINGGFRFPSSLDGTEYFISASYLKKRFDYKFTYYRRVDKYSGIGFDTSGNPLELPAKMKTNLFQFDVRYPFDEARSIRLQVGYRNDRFVVAASDQQTLKMKDFSDNYALLRLEYVYDNTINPAINIWHGTRYKIYGDMNAQINGNLNDVFDQGAAAGKGKFTYNMGIDVRHYESIFRNFIWATRFSADLSWGTRKLLYYLGGTDNWLNPKINTNTPVNMNANYAYQTLATPLRGYKQNARNGNNVMVLNTELRLPVFATFMNRPINSAIIRNFQVTSFIDIGTAWNEKLTFKDANYTYYTGNDGTVTVKVKEGFLGPFVGGYGFGARTTIAGYFLRVDAGWPAIAFFRGKPMWYFGMGVDF